MAAAGAYVPAAPSHLVLAKRYCESHSGPPGGGFCLLGLVRGQGPGVPREGACVSVGGGGELSPSGNLGGLAGGAKVSPFLPKNVTPFFCHPNL